MKLLVYENSMHLHAISIHQYFGGRKQDFPDGGNLHSAKSINYSKLMQFSVLARESFEKREINDE
jgi:hypothetical protein